MENARCYSPLNASAQALMAFDSQYLPAFSARAERKNMRIGCHFFIGVNLVSLLPPIRCRSPPSICTIQNLQLKGAVPVGTITVKIKKNPRLFDIISDSGTLYYEYDIADKDSITLPVAAKTAMDVIESESAIRISHIGQKDILAEAPEHSRFHVCFVDGSEKLNDVEVSKAIFLEYLKYQLEDERTRWEYREYCDLFSDDMDIETRRPSSDIPIEETIAKRSYISKLQSTFDYLSPEQRRRLSKHFYIIKPRARLVMRKKLLTSA